MNLFILPILDQICYDRAYELLKQVTVDDTIQISRNKKLDNNTVSKDVRPNVFIIPVVTVEVIYKTV